MPQYVVEVSETHAHMVEASSQEDAERIALADTRRTAVDVSRWANRKVVKATLVELT